MNFFFFNKLGELILENIFLVAKGAVVGIRILSTSPLRRSSAPGTRHTACGFVAVPVYRVMFLVFSGSFLFDYNNSPRSGVSCEFLSNERNGVAYPVSGWR